MAETRIDQPSAREIRPGPHEAKPPPARRRRPPAARVALMHGAYLVGAGLWPILDLRSFMVATGPKLEGWLPKGVGACMANIGAALVAAGVRGKVARELRILGVTTALSFAAMDFRHAGVRRSRVYLFNGVAQLGFAAAWALAEWRESRDGRRLPEAAFA
jgi:hypothetical protein